MQTEKELWLRIERGDQQAYAEMYRYYYKRFYNYGKKFVDDEFLLEDAIQETLMSIWDKRQTLSSIKYTATYFYSFFRNILFSKLKQKKQVALGELINRDPDFTVDQIIIARETDATLNQRLQKALTALTSHQREAIFLRFYEGLSYEEMASVLNITTKATYKIMAKALSCLRQSMTFFSFFLPFF